MLRTRAIFQPPSSTRPAGHRANSSALTARSCLVHGRLPRIANGARKGRPRRRHRQAWTDPGRCLIAGAVTRFRKTLLCAAFCAIGLAGLGATRGWAEESVLGRLARALAAKEAQDGQASPYLLPVIEQLAQAHLIAGAF